MMTDVVVAPSLGGGVGSVLLLTGTVPVVVVVPTVLVDSLVVIVPLLGEDTPAVWKVVGIDAVERKNGKWHFTWIDRNTSTEIRKR